MKTRIAVFVSGGGTNLQALIDFAAAGNLPSGELALVLASRADAYALTRAKEAGIPTAVVSRKESASQDTFEEGILSKLREYKIEMIVLAGFMSILSESFTSRFPKRILNVHPSLIPAFCGKGYYGLKVHEEALARGVKITGATVHFVNEIPDGGEIIFQGCAPVLDGDTPEILQRRVMEEVEWKLLPKATEKVAADILADKDYPKMDL
ncbi:MAG: phosphoribosylglycinamide formyltransferase [Clostridia bacterium]|nr:phosphoribosylglycinamide formyltransferase [Clostridia bacterium]